MLTNQELEELKQFSNAVRCSIVKMVHAAKSGHPGGSLSAADIMTVLYNKSLNIPKEWSEAKDFANRDRFILSKGHASPVLYATLAEYGMIPKEELLNFRHINSRLQGHPTKDHAPGIEASTGSLGHGLAMGCGIAVALKLDKNPANVVVYLGDGEIQEGSCWEAFMQAAHRNLDNMIAIIDRNFLQIDGSTEDVMSLGDVTKKLEAFGWEVVEIDGHDYNQIYEAVEQGKKANKPFAIVANTVKGKGVSFMENQAGWHGKAPNDEQLKLALQDLGEI